MGPGNRTRYGAMVGEVGPTGLNTHELYNRTVYECMIGNSMMLEIAGWWFD